MAERLESGAVADVVDLFDRGIQDSVRNAVLYRVLLGEPVLEHSGDGRGVRSDAHYLEHGLVLSVHTQACMGDEVENFLHGLALGGEPQELAETFAQVYQELCIILLISFI